MDKNTLRTGLTKDVAATQPDTDAESELGVSPTLAHMLQLQNKLPLQDANMMRERMAAGRRKAAESGMLMGRPTYGFHRHGTLRGVRVKDEQAAKIVEEIFKRIANGTSAAAIAEDLSRRKIAPPAQAHRADASELRKPWTAGAVGRIVRCPLYFGVACWGKRKSRPNAGTDDAEMILAQRPEFAIVHKDLWAAANARFAERSTRGRVRHLLLGSKRECAPRAH